MIETEAHRGCDPALGGFIPAVFEVRARRRETRDTVTLSVAPAAAPRDTSSPPTYRPGQYNMLYAHGVGEIPVSISGDAPDGALLHTIRDVGAVSAALCALRPGDRLGLRGPYGTAWPVEELRGRSVMIVAGGIGLAPLRPAIRYIVRHRRDYGRVLVAYGARTPSDALYPSERSRWTKPGKSTIEVTTTVDHGDSDWHGAVGVVTGLLPKRLDDAPSWGALVCGPEIMMRFVAHDLGALGVPRDSIYLSMERNMKCAIGLCGHCQLGRYFVCRDGAVFALPQIDGLMTVKEL